MRRGQNVNYLHFLSKKWKWTYGLTLFNKIDFDKEVWTGIGCVEMVIPRQ